MAEPFGSDQTIRDKCVAYTTEEECNNNNSDFEIEESKAISGNNDKTVPSQTLESCKKLCLEETSFVCNSFDYSKTTGTCYLSKESKFGDGVTMRSDNNYLLGERFNSGDSNQLKIQFQYNAVGECTCQNLPYISAYTNEWRDTCA